MSYRMLHGYINYLYNFLTMFQLEESSDAAVENQQNSDNKTDNEMPPVSKIIVALKPVTLRDLRNSSANKNATETPSRSSHTTSSDTYAPPSPVLPRQPSVINRTQTSPIISPATIRTLFALDTLFQDVLPELVPPSSADKIPSPKRSRSAASPLSFPTPGKVTPVKLAKSQSAEEALLTTPRSILASAERKAKGIYCF